MVSLSLAGPAMLAALSYLNAKWQVSSDVAFVTTMVHVLLRQKRLERDDRANLFYLLEEQAQSADVGARNFLWFEGQSYTFRQTYDAALRWANYLKNAKGVGRGDIVAVDCMNHPKMVFATFALYSLGAKPAYINYNLTGQPLLHCVRASNAVLLLYDDQIAADKITGEVRTALAAPDFRADGKGAVETLEMGGALAEQISNMQPHREPDSARSGAGFTAGHDKTGMLIFTSGTTGLPKPAIVSWLKLQASGIIMTRWGGLNKDDIYYTCMPLYHSTATILALLPCLFAGACCAVGHRFSNTTFWPEVRASRATIIQYVGETCRYLLAAPPQVDPKTGEDLDRAHCVRMAFGNGMRPDVWDRFKERFGIEVVGEFYSATESPHSSWNLSRNAFTAGAIGRAGKLALTLFGRRVALVRLDLETEEPVRDPAAGNFCIRCAPDEPGEMIIALDPNDIAYNFQGYFGNSAASDRKILRDVFVAGDAYFRSGDLLKVDSEGRQYFLDRIGDTFRWRSENVSTNEVSGALGLHPAVSEANVYGVQLPHHDGRAGCAAVTLDADSDRSGGGRDQGVAPELPPDLAADLARHAAASLPRYAVPLFVRLTRDQMVTGNNKQQKHIFRQQGVDPARLPATDRMYWLPRPGEPYRPFTPDDWRRLQAGQVKL